MIKQVIEGKKCILLPFEPVDALYFAEVYKDNEDKLVNGFIEGEFDVEVLAKEVQSKHDAGKLDIWIARTRQGSKARNIGFLVISDNMGYKATLHGFVDKQFLKDIAKQLDERYTYTEDALKTMIDWCFDYLKLQRLDVGIRAENKLSLKICTKVGFKLEGTLRNYLKIGNGFHDLVALSITPNDRG